MCVDMCVYIYIYIYGMIYVGHFPEFDVAEVGTDPGSFEPLKGSLSLRRAMFL